MVRSARPSPARAIPSAVEAVLDGVRACEAEIANRLPADWVADNGPVVKDFQSDGMVFLQRAWEDLRREQKVNKKEPAELRAYLVALAAVAVKLAADTSSPTHSRRTAAATAVAAGSAFAALHGLEVIPGVDDAVSVVVADDAD